MLASHLGRPEADQARNNTGTTVNRQYNMIAGVQFPMASCEVAR
jgi:hypothetical protein